MWIASFIGEPRVRAVVALLVLATLAASAAPAAAPVVEQVADPAARPGTITLVGTVRDTAGRALEGAEVRVGERLAALTDARGAFTLRGVPAADARDTVRLVVRRIGFERREARVPVEGAGRRVTLDVRLVPAVLALRTVFVDRQYVRAAMPGPAGDRGLALADLVAREELHAVEVYPTMNSVPAEFVRIGPASGGSGRASTQIPSPVKVARSRRGGEAGPGGESNDAACGAIVIWTRTFTARR